MNSDLNTNFIAFLPPCAAKPTKWFTSKQAMKIESILINS